MHPTNPLDPIRKFQTFASFLMFRGLPCGIRIHRKSYPQPNPALRFLAPFCGKPWATQARPCRVLILYVVF